MDELYMFILSDNSRYMKNTTFDFKIKDGYFENSIDRSGSAFLLANKLSDNNVTLNLNFEKLTFKTTRNDGIPKLLASNGSTIKLNDVVGSDSKVTIKNTVNNATYSITDMTLSATNHFNSVTGGTYYDILEITKEHCFNVSDVTFTKTYGYSAGTPETISIYNSGENALKIKNVSVNSSNFTIVDGSQTTLASGETDTTWGIKANTGLSKGTYTAEITVTDENDRQYTSTVTLTVNPKKITGATISIPTSVTYGETYNPTLSTTLGSISSSGVYEFVYTTKLGTSYTPATTNKPTKVGTYIVTIRLINDNYEIGVTDLPTVSFKIVAKTITPTVDAISDETYTGEQITPDVCVRYNGVALTKGTDYTVEYDTNTDVGTGKATIKAVSGSNYKFTNKEVTFNIVAKTLTDSDVTLTQTSYRHTGSEIKPEPVVKVGDKTLVKDTDYELSYSDNTDIGENTAKVTVTGKGNYTGNVNKNFSIIDKIPQEISFAETNITNTYGDSDFTITANHTTGDGAVTYTSTNTDVATVNATTGKVTILKAGTTTIKATASETADYAEATAEYTLTVNKKELSFTATVNDKEFDYTINATVAGITFNGLVGSESLTKDTDYTVTAEFLNESAGENKDVKVTITLDDTSVTENYKLVNANYTAKADITPKTILDSWVTVVAPSTYTYNGSAIKPNIIVKDGVTLLEKDAFYTVEYVNNINAGTGIIKVTAKDNYKGTVEKEFTINKKSITPTIENIADVTYNGNEQKPELVVKDETTTLAKNRDYTVEYDTNTDVGTGKATIKAVSGSNYTFTNTEKTFNIIAKTLTDSDVTLTQTSYRHTGSEIKPEPVVKDGDKTLVKGTDYELSYSDNKNVGENTAKVTVTGKGNYTGTVNKNFSILDKESQAISFAETTITKTYGDNDFTKIAEHTTGNGNVTYTSTNTDVATVNATTGKVTIKKAGTTTIKATASETENYAEATAEYTLTVNKKELSFTATVNNKVFDNNKTATVSGISFTGLVGSESLTKDTDYTVTAEFTSANVGNDIDVNVTITLEDTNVAKNYKLVNTSYTAKANITGKEIQASGVTVDTSTTYSYNGSSIEPNVTVKDGSTDLIKNTHYTVEYSNNINAGTGKVKISGIGKLLWSNRKRIYNK